MRVEFDASFSKCLDRIKDKTISAKVIQLIEEAEKASDIIQSKTLKSYPVIAIITGYGWATTVLVSKKPNQILLDSLL